MSEEYTCIECENLYDDSDGNTEKRMCNKCVDKIYAPKKEGGSANLSQHSPVRHERRGCEHILKESKIMKVIKSKTIVNFNKNKKKYYE